MVGCRHSRSGRRQAYHVLSFVLIRTDETSGSILSPILAGLQTFLRFPERAMQHREAAIKFGVLKTEEAKKVKK